MAHRSHRVLTHTDWHSLPPTLPVRPTVQIESATPDLQAADVVRRSSRTAVVTAEPFAAVGGLLTSVSDVVPWSGAWCTRGRAGVQRKEN